MTVLLEYFDLFTAVELAVAFNHLQSDSTILHAIRTLNTYSLSSFASIGFIMIMTIGMSFCIAWNAPTTDMDQHQRCPISALIPYWSDYQSSNSTFISTQAKHLTWGYSTGVSLSSNWSAACWLYTPSLRRWEDLMVHMILTSRWFFLTSSFNYIITQHCSITTMEAAPHTHTRAHTHTHAH